jgi:hypothetical protein
MAVDAETRATVLGVLLKVMDGLPAGMTFAEWPVPLGADEVTALDAATDEDFALATACLSVEQGLRCDAILALERSLGLLPPGGSGTLDDRLRRLPSCSAAFAQAASGLYDALLVYGAARET